MAKQSWSATGRRKRATAQVTLTSGTGNITVNGVDVNEYMPYQTLVMDLKQPLVLTNNENRFDMLKILTQKNKNFSVSNYEFSENVVYTCETLDYFKNKYLKDEIFFICGADNLSYIDKWKNGEEILKNYKIIVIARNTDNLESILKKYSKYTDNILVARIPPYDLSSTEIRKLISDGKYHLLDKYLDCDIIDYIIENNLYM